MGLLGYDKITITDLMDAVPASLTFTSNINSEVQKKQGNSYEPNLEEGEGLIITPSFFIGNEEISLEKITEELMGGSNQESHCGIFVVYQIDNKEYYYNEDVSIDSSKIYVDIDNKLHYKQNLENSITIKGYIEKYEDKNTGSLYANIKVSNPITINFITFESGYSAFIENNGRNHFDENNTNSIKLKAVLYYGTEEYFGIKSYEWKQVGNKEFSGSDQEISIDRSAIGAFDKFICTITTEEGLTFKVSENIYDRTDGYQSRIVAYDSLIFTPKHTIIKLENQVWYGTSQLNENNSNRFEYSWFYFSKEKEEEGEEVLKKNILSSSNDKGLSLDNSNLPKENFTLYCQTLINKKTTVLSEVDIKYSAINYEVQITPNTVYIPTNNEGTYRGEGTFSKIVNFKIIDLDTGALVPFKGGEEEIKPNNFSLKDSSPFSINVDEDKDEWNFNITISENKVGEINKNSFSNDLTIPFDYKYLGADYSNQIELIENRSGEVGQPGYSIDLTNSFHSFGGTATAANQGETTEFGIQAYYGDADLNITKITIVDGNEEIQIYSDKEESSKSSIYYPDSNSCLRIDYERKNVIKKEEVEGEEETYLSSEGLFTLTTGPFGEEKPDSSFLQKGGKITLKISVNADNLITRTFTRDFGYNVNYDNNSYYLAFPNGNSIVYLPSKNSYNPSTLTVVTNQKNSDDVISSYDGVIWYALDDGKTDKDKLNWTYLEGNLELNNISPSTKRIQFELYSANSPTDDYPNGEDLLDLEDIPILHSLEGTEIGGENLLLWTKTFSTKYNRWHFEDTDNLISVSEEINNECSILDYLKKPIEIQPEEEEEGEEESEVGIINENNIETNLKQCIIYSPYTERLSKETLLKNFIFSYYFKEEKVEIEVEGQKENSRASYSISLEIEDTEGTKVNLPLYTFNKDEIESLEWTRKFINFSIFDYSEASELLNNSEENINYNLRIIINFLGKDQNENYGHLSFKKLKLETGNILTDWRESYLDIEYVDLASPNLLTYQESYLIEVPNDNFKKEFPLFLSEEETYYISWDKITYNSTELSENDLTNLIFSLYGIWSVEIEQNDTTVIQEKEEEIENFFESLKQGNNFNQRYFINKFQVIENSEPLYDKFKLIFDFSKVFSSSEDNGKLEIHQLKIEENSEPTSYFLGDSFIEQLAEKYGQDSIALETIQGQIESFSPSSYVKVDDLTGKIVAVTQQYLAEKPIEDEKIKRQSDFFSKIQKGVIIATGEGEGPYIEISTKQFKSDSNDNDEETVSTLNAIKITNNRISFTENDREVAFINNEKLYIKQAHLAETFIIGEELTSGELVVSITPTGVGFKWGNFKFKEE